MPAPQCISAAYVEVPQRKMPLVVGGPWSVIPFLAPTPEAQAMARSVHGVTVVEERGRFLTLVRSAPCALVWCPALTNSPESWRWLRQLVATHPITPIIAVAPFDLGTARALAALPSMEVVWRHEALEALPSMVSAYQDLDPVRAVERLYAAAGLLGPASSAAVRRLCDLDRSPILTVSDLLPWLGDSKASQRQAWRGQFGPIALKESVDWVLLLRALIVGKGTRGPVETALLLGVHERRLDRVCQRLTGRSFAAARKPGGIRKVVAMFRERFEAVLAARAASEAPRRA